MRAVANCAISSRTAGSAWMDCSAATPKGTPQAITTAMQAEMRKALNADDLKAIWNGLGTETPNLYGDPFGRFVGSEIKRWAEVVKSSGAKLD